VSNTRKMAFGTIRKTLTLLVSLAILPVLILIVYSGLERRGEAIENAKREVMFLARTMGDVQKGITHSTHQILAALAQITEMQGLDGPECSRIFRAVVEKNPDYINILAVDLNGDVFASSMPFDRVNLADRRHVRDALARKVFSAGEYIVTRVGRTLPSFTFAYPILDALGNPRAVLTVALRLERFAHLFETTEPPENSFLAVTDRNGIRIFYYPLREKTNPIGRPITQAAWDAARGSRDSGISIHEGSDGVRRIFAFQPVRFNDGEDPYMCMWAGIPEAHVLRPANLSLACNLALMALVAALALTIAWLVGRKTLVSPINRLAAATRTFAGGDLHIRSGMSHVEGELGTLARAFDDMADALVDSQERLRTIADHTYDWEYWMAPDGRLIWVSPSCERVTGYTPDEFIEDPELIARVVDPADMRRFKAHAAVGIGDNETRELDFRIVHKSGRTVWIDHHCVPIVRPDSTFLGRRVSNRDITERKDIETRLNQAQKSEAIGALAGGIAHDFNNLLFPIIGLSEMLLEDLPAGSPERENMTQIIKAARRAEDLVNQILSFSRQAEHKKIPIRIQQVLKEVGKLVRSTIPSNIEIRQSIQADCDPVLADPTNLHQIAMNLITNAYHAVEENSGSISIELRQTTLDPEDGAAEDLQPGSYAVLSVSDTGHGIPRGLLDKIFDPYFTTKPQGKGTGLGLSVAYGIVKEHGGEIRVYSEAGQGTTFKVYLPLLAQDETSDGQPVTVEHPTGHERILLVDDEAPIAYMGEQVLKRLGYRVTAYTSSTDALEAFRTDPTAYDLVITDMAMPNMTGDRLARQLIALRPDIPVILCTGFSENVTAATIESLGIKGLLMKPMVRGELAAMIRRVLDET